jgi:hypothetical protein
MSGDEIQEHEPPAFYFDQRQTLHFFRYINEQGETNLPNFSVMPTYFAVSATNLFSPTQGLVQSLNLTNFLFVAHDTVPLK